MRPIQTVPARPAVLLAALGSGADILTGAVWVAVCAASPEFIWRGARLMHGHISRAELWTAIPLGLVLAFFVEPLFERLRHAAIGHVPHVSRARGPAFHVLVGITFALCAICVHHAMTGLANAFGAHPAGGAHAAPPAVALTLGWALVPLTITLAWRSALRPALCAVLTVAAAISPLAAGIAFDWSRSDIVTTAIPCAAILFLNLHRLRHDASWRVGLRTVAEISALWLLFALLADLLLDASGLKRFSFYSPAGYWMDVRFYLGWLAGLWLVPPDIAQPAPANPEAAPPPAPTPILAPILAPAE